MNDFVEVRDRLHDRVVVLHLRVPLHRLDVDDGGDGLRHSLLGFAQTFLVSAATEQCCVFEECLLLLEVFPTTKTENLLIAGNFEMSSLVFLQRAAVTSPAFSILQTSD